MAWTLRQERVNCNATSAMFTSWKKSEELAFLSEALSVPLQQTRRNLQGAVGNFWPSRAEYPTFKSRTTSRSPPGTPAAVPASATAGATPFTVTVARDAAGRWFVSMLCDDIPAPMPGTENAVGIDAGITGLVTLSTGEKVTDPRHARKDRARLTKAQRVLAKEARGDGANRAKARRKAAKVLARNADRRRDFLHKLTTRLVRENRTIVIEDLTLRNMVRNHALARAVSDLLAIGRWFPSSKLCSACGALRGKIPPHVRDWTCECGATHDRDVNAAENVLAEGLSVTVCGAGVRPQRVLRAGSRRRGGKPHGASRGNPSPSGGGGCQFCIVCAVRGCAMIGGDPGIEERRI